MPSKVQRKADLRAIVNGLADEVCLGASARIEVLLPNEDDALDAVEHRKQAEHWLSGDLGPASLPHGEPHMRRASLARIASTCLTLLAIDEAARGEDVIEREVEQYDLLGHFVRRLG